MAMNIHEKHGLRLSSMGLSGKKDALLGKQISTITISLNCFLRLIITYVSQTRARKLIQWGLSEGRSRKSASNGHGPRWNSGASHMNEAFSKKYFDCLGLVSLLDHYRKLQGVT